MIVIRRRLIFWLVKEYIKKWGKAIVLSFFIGLFVFFVLMSAIRYFLPKIPLGRNESIGIVGSYTLDKIPQFMLQDVSLGLTSISPDGSVVPQIARQWKIENDGKKYTFFLRQDVYFSDKSKVTSENISYNFSDVVVKKPNDTTIVFELRDSYSPFLTTVSRPIFKKGFIGTGEYILKDVKLNGDFVQSLTLSSVKNQYITKTYQFYSTSDSLKTAYVLGEVSKAIGLFDIEYKNNSFDMFPNTIVSKIIDYGQLVTLFYNTQDSVLSDKRVRSALSYALPNDFTEGKRAYLPFSPKSWAYGAEYEYAQDIDGARILLSTSETGSKSASLNIEIKTLPGFEKTAKEVVEAWKKIGVEGKITLIDRIPDNFQVFLGNFSMPKDPDQYTLWHSGQSNNITRYENKRIDKLLEDGRKTVNIEQRKKIYSDFQKYLLADAPASFLYFPYEYEVTKR